MMKIQILPALLVLACSNLALAESQTLSCQGDVNVEITVPTENNQEIASLVEIKISGQIEKSVPTQVKTNFWSKGASLMDAGMSDKMDTASIESSPREIAQDSAFTFYHSEGYYEKIEGDGNDSFIRIDGKEYGLSCVWK